MSVVFNRIAGFFQRVNKAKQEAEEHKVETFDNLVERILKGAKLSEEETLQVLETAGRSVEELQAEVNFHLEVQRLDEKLSRQASLLARKADLEEAAAASREAANEVSATHVVLVREAEAAVRAVDNALVDCANAKSEKGRLIQAKHAARLAAIRAQIIPLEKQAFELRSQAGHTPIAELEARTQPLREEVAALEKMLEQHALVIQARPLKGHELTVHHKTQHQLRKAKDQLAVAEARANNMFTVPLRKVEERIAQLRQEAALITASP